VLDLLLIHPGAAHGIYGVLGDELVAVEPPLWCRLIAGYVRDRGHSVRILDAEALRLDPKQVAALTAEFNPRLVCLAVYGHQPSASTQQMDGAGKTAREIKKLNLSCKVIMVGGHVAALPERTLREEAVDFVCKGEGPITVERLLCGLKKGWDSWVEDVPGLGELVLGNIEFGPPTPLIENLSELHGNVWDLLPMDRYVAHNWQCLDDPSKRQPYASVYTSLGCPYRCHFCMINSIFETNRYRMREPAQVVQEMVFLYGEYGVKTFKIVDEMFVLNERHYKAICDRLILSGISKDINIWAYSRIDTVKPENLFLLRQAGFKWLALGIESGSAHVRDGASKKLRNDDIVGVVRAIQQANINVIGNYIFGLPDDDAASMQQTLDLALTLRTEFANFYSAMAYPGSWLYTEAVEKGWELPSSWRGYSQHNSDCLPLATTHVSAKQVLAFRDAAFQTYFNDPGYLRMIENKFGLAALAEIKKMTSYKLERKLLAA
jgi:anaerobic magnesium-protoporphyrin IX monomethyl ester cyclase